MKISSDKLNQTGSTLLLAVLVLSALTLVALAVAKFTVQEIRSSRATTLSEPALTAAEAGAETGLFAIKRGDPTTVKNCDASPTYLKQTNVNAGSVTCRSYLGSNFDILEGQSTIFYLFDPNDPNGDVDLLAYPYAYLNITNNGNSSVQVDIVRIDNTPLAGSPYLIAPGDTAPFSIPAVPSGSEGRMKITLSSPIGSAGTVYATTDKGLPYNIQVVSAGCSAKASLTSCTPGTQELFNRKIQVSVKNSGQQLVNSSTVTDIKADGSDGPLAITSGTAVNITWTSTNASTCSISPALPGYSGTLTTNPGTGVSSGPLTASQTTFTVTCQGPGGTGSNSVVVNIVKPPVLGSATINPKPIAPGNLNIYTITMSSTDPNGGVDIVDQYAAINRQGASAGTYRGYIGWSTVGFRYWTSIGSAMNCTGGGQAGINTGAGFGSSYVSLVSCTTSVISDTRTTTINLKFNSTFQTPTTNVISGFVDDTGALSDGWAITDTFNLALPMASGGTLISIPGYRVHIFTSSGTLNVTSPGRMEYLIVGGGGGGGGGDNSASGGGGGGGGGGFVTGSTFVTSGSVPITVGGGGIGATVTSCGTAVGGSGSASAFGGYASANGGGGGASGACGNSNDGKTGGSGGGGARTGGGGIAVAGQGNNGGAGVDGGAGGGGGAGSPGGSASGCRGGNGGSGSISNIDGNSNVYAGGGGGGGCGLGYYGSGSGGGGNGGNYDATPGSNNRGSGGGGGAGVGNGKGGNGGSGIVIVRYEN